jgi:hypothetical protein
LRSISSAGSGNKLPSEINVAVDHFDDHPADEAEAYKERADPEPYGGTAVIILFTNPVNFPGNEESAEDRDQQGKKQEEEKDFHGG